MHESAHAHGPNDRAMADGGNVAPGPAVAKALHREHPHTPDGIPEPVPRAEAERPRRLWRAGPALACALSNCLDELGLLVSGSCRSRGCSYPSCPHVDDDLPALGGRRWVAARLQYPR